MLRCQTARLSTMVARRPRSTQQTDRMCFPRAARQRCLAHRMRNLASKVPEDVWPEFKARVQSVYQAPSRAIARELAAGIVADYGREQEGGVACFMDDFEACIAHLRFPVTHRRAIRTTNLLERLFVEERRRLKIIPECKFEWSCDFLANALSNRMATVLCIGFDNYVKFRDQRYLAIGIVALNDRTRST
jgi:transposase-like protein